jgi:hypothetical protein
LWFICLLNGLWLHSFETMMNLFNNVYIKRTFQFSLHFHSIILTFLLFVIIV